MHNPVLGYLLVSIGGITGTVMDIRNILQTALKANACSIIIAHNHPSGNLDPSETDKRLTKMNKVAGTLLEIQLWHHIILTV
jgi:DNA repair protein RadC